ncbi:DUF3320 domain-containing protein [Dysgonomonas sp. HDW5B]|uniref:DUF3320 domain-containing protein n=1 Tax=Dysgonomonas sp. HDW5B TaxID=2714927 RepID=UPI00140BADC0|nr:DUF3320 domain-containing protein [Dysgonomonas sp. HDW5B]QIK52895.1 DUF3320 domain-containing protein [Dysgonomonas sp. HDW5B]
MEEKENPVKVEFIYLPVINYALQQNRVSLIRQFTIENTSDDILEKVKVVVSFEPDFALSSSHIIEVIPVGETVRINSLKLSLSPNYFAQLTERCSGNIKIEVRSNGIILFKQIYPIDILTFDQWGGVSILPEMLSAFITPNHPALGPIIQRTSFILGHWTGDPSLDSYQSSNLDRPWKQMAAVYAAISELNITYSTAPASFEAYGQRVRLLDNILSQKMGNCLDISLLYAACLEEIGLHPFIIITQGHAFTGAWLVAETFPDSIVDDASLLNKRIANGINEIALIESTCICTGHQVDFSSAVKIANNKLSQTSDFVLALDVQRSRYAGIRPLPQRILNGAHWEVKENTPATTESNQGTPEKLNRYDLSTINKEIEVTKQLLWERKLLDLSLRNNLLNIRMTRATLQLISVDLDKFEDALAEGEEFQIISRPTDWDHPLYDSKIQNKLEATDPVIALVRSELKQKRLRSYLSEVELNKALYHLYKSSRLSIEENGANTLYLALGLLKWFETPNSVQPRYAPILLLPVEIIRKSVSKGYIIRTREEDTMMNITLLEMLRQNFGISISSLDSLPTDHSGVDVNLIYTIIRNSIKNEKRWDLEEQAVLGIFSFNKFIMWNDIHNNSDKLTKNEIVSSLISGKIEWNIDTQMTDATVLEKTLQPSEIVLPISADSSQLEAVFEAVNDKSYILHGPPGTGKSQTITNIIANALYKGKRVLFVAEKMAALSVVQSRLEAIGLAPFCLELHSNKSKKSAVLAQLKNTSEIVRLNSPENFKNEADRLFQLRTELNTYVNTLHKKSSFGLSLYDSIVRYLSIENGSEFKFSISALNGLSGSKIQEWQDAIEILVNVANTCGHPYQHPLDGIKISNYSAQKKEEIENILKNHLSVLANFNADMNVIYQLFGIKEKHGDKARIKSLLSILNKVLIIPELTPGLLTRPRLSEVLEEYREIITHERKRNKIIDDIRSKYMDDVLSLNAKQLLMEWNQSSDKWLVSKHLDQKRIKKQLKVYSLDNSIEDEEVRNLLTQLISYREECEYIGRHNSDLFLLFGKFGKPNSEDWNMIEQILEGTSELNKLILEYTQDIGESSIIKESLAKQLTEGIGPFKNMHGNAVTYLEKSLDRLSVSDDILLLTLGINRAFLYGNSLEWSNEAESRINLWLANMNKLRDWYQWTTVCDRLEKLGIGFVAEEYKSKNLPTDTFINTFNKSFYHACIACILSENPNMELFKGQLFNETIQKYKRMMTDFEDLTKREVYARLASNIPLFTKEAAQNSEVGILQKNIRNNGRAMSLRRLFDQIPTLLSRMCPCMLMSPISVAQYIDPEAEKFDLIIFDEASQMPTYEAIGAIARGKNVIIVGDPKQMPPTSFFAANTIDEDNIEIEDLESILDDCLALSIPSKHLLWHYRSKHESLIAFSNSEYYDNKLLTFPSPDNIDSKVKYVPVKGFYDKGKTRQNKAEAQAVVNEIEKRLSHPGLRKRSIGVVTFSSMQQILIEELLSDLFTFRPDLENYAMECKEPLFIKNLENVQGDERDVILFSIGYGPDANGNVSMNFGPLNRVGGERRLNVAVSRARYEMIIYSTLRSDQIDLNRTSSVGVGGLKRFLEYAEKGERIVLDSQTNTHKSLTTIEDIIASKLQNQGYIIHTNIGCSGYKVSIGIVDPTNPLKYLLGIICDGESYKETKTTRDREIVQNSVLQLLGWHIYRVWTMDWWENSERLLEEIIKAIKDAELKKEDNSVISDLPELPVFEEIYTNPISDMQQEVPLQSAPASIDQVHITSVSSNSREYLSAILNPVNLSSDSFLFDENIPLIKSQIKEVVDFESPISKSLLCKRILSAWGISRLGQRLDAHFEQIFKSLPYYRTNCEDLSFFWFDREQCNSFSTYRPDSNRDAVDLPSEEVANMVRHILEEQISLPTKDLSKIAGQNFGFARSGTNVEAAMYRGIRTAVDKGYIKVENGKAIVV